MTDDLLVKYLVGEASTEEGRQVETWLARHKDNQDYFNGLGILWQESLALAPQANINEDAAWNRFRRNAEQLPSAPSLLQRMPWLKIAALLLVAALGTLTYLVVAKIKDRVPLQVIASGSPVTDTLPDGSVVVLNKHASVSYPDRFTGEERRVQLTGEGFFSVVHNAQQPFIVDCAGINIKVVGTSFNIKSGTTGTEVIVETGRVLVTRNLQTILLQPGEKVFVNNNDKTMEKSINTDRLYTYYRNRSFICDATPLWKLVQVLNEAYDADIVIANKNLSSLPISTTFNNEPLDKILAVISETFTITVEKKDGRVLLK